MDWTLALAQHAVQQEGEQMAPIMYHQTSLQSWLFNLNMSHSVFLHLTPNVINVWIASITNSVSDCSTHTHTHPHTRTHTLAYLLKICSVLYLSTIRTSPQDKYLVSAGRAGLLRCSLMSVSRSIQSRVFSVHGALLP